LDHCAETRDLELDELRVSSEFSNETLHVIHPSGNIRVRRLEGLSASDLTVESRVDHEVRGRLVRRDGNKRGRRENLFEITCFPTSRDSVLGLVHRTF